MALSFPSGSTTGTTYQSGSSPVYVFNGTAWDIQASNVAQNVTSASFANTASFSSTTTRPQYISVVKDVQQNTVGINTDITWGTVEASNGLTLSSNSVTLTGGKVYQINASFSGITFSNTSGGYISIGLCNSTNAQVSTAVAILVTPQTANQWDSPTFSVIYTPATTTTIKFRTVDANGNVNVRGAMTNFTITEIL